MPEHARPSSRAAYILALCGAPHVGVWTALTTVRVFPTPDDLFGASEADLQEALGRRFANPITRIDPGEWNSLVDRAEAEIARHEASGVRVIAIDDVDYPPLMAKAPKQAQAVILYCRGGDEVLQRLDAVAVVGTREPTGRGVEVARLVTAGLVAEGFSIVSGLARGIDTVAHRAALDAGGATIAVLGTAIDKAYPAVNRDLADGILSGGGALVSEYPMGMPTSGRHFVARDRLQAALSVAVVAVQTDIDGGTMHTVRAARECERAVVVPKPLASEVGLRQYRGITQLIEGGTVGVIGSREDYPRVATFLREHRHWLLGGRTDSRPSFDGMTDPGTVADTEAEADLRLGI